VLANAYNPKDYIIIDRMEQQWLFADQSKLLLLKTFAPLSGPVVTEENLAILPIQVKRFFRASSTPARYQPP